MPERLKSTVVFDDTNGMQRVPDRDYDRHRSVHLCFTRSAGGHGPAGYDVRAWGPAFPPRGDGSYRGWLDGAEVVQEAVAVLRETWQEHLIRHVHRDPRPDGPRTVFPFVDAGEGGRVDCPHLDGIGLRLARAGNDLFQLLFYGGDTGMREIGETLFRALDGGECIVTVESDDLFVPWNLLYTAGGPAGDAQGRLVDDTWSFAGFWGHRHLVEHNFSRVRGYDSRISVPEGPVGVGLNVDDRVDEEYPPTPFVAELPGIFDRCARETAVTVRRSKSELAGAFRAMKFDDHISFFGCHGQVTDQDGAARSSWLELADGEKIYGSEIAGWLSRDEPMPMRPLVFVGACQGGQLSSAFYPAAGYHLLRNGARCLLGPQVDLPRAFAREYATLLFGTLLDRGSRLGDAVRELSRFYADDRGNPLGLIFTLYRGLDVHFWPRGPE
ncbi:hypothetical protein [Streptomyces phytophilus]|uniref:hypothetical protein n=1 Tax=Streptomyces phytophilus TaxID=722715 RepID=UPI0015F0D447|nr:hypothetical protein [Streptomyces phytophilus]